MIVLRDQVRFGPEVGSALGIVDACAVQPKAASPFRPAASHGGARSGAGRKRDVLPPEVLERLGRPPIKEPLKLARWYSAVLTEILDLYIRMGRYVEMYREVRAAMTAIRAVMPMDIVLEAARRVRDDELELDEDVDPDEEVREPDARRTRAVRRDAP